MLLVRASCAVLIAALLASCSSTAAQRKTDDPSPSPRAAESSGVPVVTAKAEVKAMPVTLDAVGAAEAISTVDIRAQITGQLQQVLFSPGQDVRKGQSLFRLDRRPLEAALRQAEAIVARDEAQLKNATVGRQRAEDLLKQGILARSEYDTNVANAAALEATLAADRAQVEQARLNLQYAEIISPLDGRTGALNAHVGDLVRTNDALPLVTINQVAPIYVSFSIPARFLDEVRKARTSGALPVITKEQHQRGEVTFIDNAVDAATATIKLKATFPNRDRELWPGLFVPVSLQLALQPHAIVVPSIAVQTSQQGQYVYVVNADRAAELRHVTVDRQQGDVSVIASGLNGGEEVVTEGQLRVTPGARVKPAPRQATTS